jgi:hypothetical protein
MDSAGNSGAFSGICAGGWPDSDNCDMVYGDVQAVLIKMIEVVRGLGLPAAA